MVGDATGCDQFIEQAGVVAARLGTPRFTWEVDELRAERLITRGDLAAGLELSDHACATIGGLRPDIRVMIGLSIRMGAATFYTGEWASGVAASRSVAAGSDWGMIDAIVLWMRSLSGEHEAVWGAIDRVLHSDLEALRGSDGSFPLATS